MNSPLRDRLHRLGVKKGGAGLKPPRPRAPSGSPFSIESLVAGREVATKWGAHFVAESAYPLSHRRGGRALADVLNCDPRIAARLSQNDSLAGADLGGLVFFDTETTGLAGGAGTLAFLIGLGSIESNQFVLRQFFLRDPAEEASLLH